MRVRNEARQEVGIPVELFARGKMRAATLVDVSLSGAMLQIPQDMALEHGEAVLVRPQGLVTAVAYVRWCDGDHVGLEFRRGLHPSVLEFALRENAASQSANPDGVITARAA